MKNIAIPLVLKGLLLSFPFTFSAMTIPVDAVAMSISRTGPGLLPTSPEPEKAIPQNGTLFKFSGTGNAPVDSVFYLKNPFGNWTININNNNGNKEIWFFEEGNRQDRQVISAGEFQKFRNIEDGFYRLRTVDPSSEKAVNLASGKIVRFRAKAVPEPFSTTAAVGLAIAGAAHTLKKKRTEDE